MNMNLKIIVSGDRYYKDIVHVKIIIDYIFQN
jgi:hypothetical protein